MAITPQRPCRDNGWESKRGGALLKEAATWSGFHVHPK
jgi:hypothetical protein